MREGHERGRRLRTEAVWRALWILLSLLSARFVPINFFPFSCTGLGVGQLSVAAFLSAAFTYGWACRGLALPAPADFLLLFLWVTSASCPTNVPGCECGCSLLWSRYCSHVLTCYRENWVKRCNCFLLGIFYRWAICCVMNITQNWSTCGFFFFFLTPCLFLWYLSSFLNWQRSVTAEDKLKEMLQLYCKQCVHLVWFSCWHSTPEFAFLSKN